ncbi:MAG: hypothetical protein QXM53_09805 [Thermofilaceae archaeon]
MKKLFVFLTSMIFILGAVSIGLAVDDKKSVINKKRVTNATKNATEKDNATVNATKKDNISVNATNATGSTPTRKKKKIEGC